MKMNNKKATKRALLTSVMALAMCVVMLIGTTFAWFTDTATANVNRIQSGKLDIVLLDKNDAELASDHTLGWEKAANAQGEDVLWEPNCTYDLETFKIKNAGDLAVKYKVVLKASTIEERNGKTLLDVLTWKVTVGNEAAVDKTNEIRTALATGAPVVVDAKLLPLQDNVVDIKIQAKMDANAGNDYQNLKIDGFGITVYATQASYESDSQDNTYDLYAEYSDDAPYTPPVVTVSTAAELQAALTPTAGIGNEVVINLAGNIALAAGENWTPLNLEAYKNQQKNVIINGNGYTISNLNQPLLGYCYFGNTSIEINDLTIADSQMTQTAANALGYGAFVASTDYCAKLTLKNCHLKNSSVTAIGDDAAGGLVGSITGEVATSIVDCSVENCTISGTKNAGAIMGRYGYDNGNVETSVSGCTVENVTLSGWYKGLVAGQLIQGTMQLSDFTVSGTNSTTNELGRNNGGTLNH